MGRRARRGLFAAVVVFASALVLGGCVRVGYEPVARRDGGPAAPRGDAGALDAGLDASHPDASRDAGGVADANESPQKGEAGVPDDAGTADAGDSGVAADGGVPDAGGPSDSGTPGDSATVSEGGTSGDGGAEELLEGANSVAIGSMTFGGSGCSASDSVADPSDRPMRLHLNFMQFALQAAAGGSASSTCDLELPLEVPAGLSLRMVGGAWHGDYNRSASASGSFSAEYGFEGDAPRSSTLPVGSELGGSFDATHDVRDTSNPDAGWTTCSDQPREVIAQATGTLTGSNGITFAIRSGDVFRIESRYCTP